MHTKRFSLYLAAGAAFCWGSSALAEPSSIYKVLDSTVAPPPKLRTDPSVLAKSPRMFCSSLSASHELHAVDIQGSVWKWAVAAEEGKKRERLIQAYGEPGDALLSPGANLLATAKIDAGIAVMDLQTQQLRFEDTWSGSRTVALSFSPDSSRLAAVTVAGEVRVWEVNTGKHLCDLTTRPGPIQTIAFSPDCQQLALASFSPEVILYELREEDDQDAAVRQVLNESSSRVTALAYSPNGHRLVIARSDGTVAVHEVAGGREPILLGTQPFAIWSLAFERGGGRMAAGSWDGSIRIWDSNSWELLQSLKSHDESVAALTFDNHGGLVSSGLDGKLLYWLAEVPAIPPGGALAGRPDSVWVATYSPNGRRLFVGGRQQRFELWDAETMQLLVSRKGQPTTRCASFSSRGGLLATGGDDGSIQLCDSDTGEPHTTLRRHPGAVSAVVFADDGRTLVSVCDGGVVKLWDTATFQEKASWQEHQQQIYCATISPDEKWLLTGGGNWTTGDPGELIVWDLGTGRVRDRLIGHKLAVWSIVFWPDGKQFASSDSSGAVKVWNLQTLQEVRSLQHGMWVRPLALSPGGRTLAVGRGDGSVRLWDTTSWTQTASCSGHESFTFWLQYAPGRETLASAGNDGTVLFWDTSLAASLRPLPRPTGSE